MAGHAQAQFQNTIDILTITQKQRHSKTVLHNQRDHKKGRLTPSFFRFREGEAKSLQRVPARLPRQVNAPRKAGRCTPTPDHRHALVSGDRCNIDRSPNYLYCIWRRLPEAYRIPLR